MRKCLGAAVVIGMVGLATPMAHADERSDARRHFRMGMDLITHRHYAEGIAQLEAAYAILPHPNVLYNIARAYNDEGNTERAVDYLRRYLLQDVPDRTEVETILARLENRMRQRLSNGGAATASPGVATTPGTPVNGIVNAPADTTPVTIPAGGSAQAQALRQAALSLIRTADQLQGTRTTPPGTPGAAAGSNTVSAAGNATNTAISPGSGEAASAGTAASGEPVNVGTGETGDVYEERVVTASRAAQSPLDAPNATGVITAQDIRLSGITNVPELLRRIAGVEVMMLDNSDVQVSVRGFNQRLSNKVLVLLDGRSMYLDFLGVTIWNTIFPAVEEIERIEVIRGPGSALYGADAFTGVINIITRPPGESRNQLSFGAGTGQSVRGAYSSSGRSGDLSYRASIQYEQRAAFDRPVSETDQTWRSVSPTGDIGYRAPRFMLDVQNRFARGVVLRGGIGASNSVANFTATGLLRRFWSEITFIQPYVQLEAHGFTGRVFWNRMAATAGPILVANGGGATVANVQQDVIDVDLQYLSHQSFGIAQNTVQLGVGYRLKHISWNYLDRDHTLHFFSAYLQDTLRIGSMFSAVLSARADLNPVLDAPVLSPRAALIFKPTERRAIRLSGGTAFRTPTMLELYFDLYYPTPIPGLTVQGQGGEVHSNYGQSAGRLRPESALSFDVGYQDNTFDRVQLQLNLFWTRGTDLINLTNVMIDPIGSTTSNNREVNVGRRYFANEPGATYVYGGELGLRLSPIDGLDVYANYTLSITQHESTSPLAQRGDRAADQRTPMHKLNLGFQVRTRVGIDFELFGHYVSNQVWVEPVFDPVQGSRDVAFSLRDYVVMNARLGYRMLNDRLDVGIVGSNLADVVYGGHTEHPLGSRITTRVLGTASYRF